MKKLIFTTIVFLLTAIASASQLEVANEILQDALNDRDFNQTYIYDGCFVRAHYLSFALHERGIKSYKIIITPTDNDKKITFKSKIHTELRSAKWIYHVVTAIKDKENIYILDPLISPQIIKLKKWIEILKDDRKNFELEYKILPPSEYRPEKEENDEFKRLGPPFSERAMRFIKNSMDILFIYDDFES